MGLNNPRNLIGRKRIVAKISYKDFYENPMENTKKVLNKCISQHRENIRDFEYLEEQYRGHQDILTKTRDDGSPYNNIIVENRLFEFVNFQTGFLVGRPIEYSYKGEKTTDDMDYFNRYISDSNKASLDVETYSHKFIFGIAHRMIISKRNDYDIEYEAPFEIINLDNKDVFVCYDSTVEKKKLFSCIINENYDESGNKKTNYTIYLNDGRYFELSGKASKYEVVIGLTSQSIKFNPVIECPLNEYRIGLVELLLSLQNAVNGLDSLQEDDIEQFVSSFIVFENQEINEEFYDTLDKLKKQRVLAVKSNNPQLPAKVSILASQLDHTQVNEFYTRLLNAMYDIGATPKASGNVTSGGDTTGARLLGNGWETAQNRAELNTTFMQRQEYEQLKMMFNICKFAVGNKIDKLFPSNIEIKFNINMSNNLQVKTQSLMNLHTINMPKDIALAMVGLTNDTYGVANKWEEYENKKVEENLKNANTNNDPNDNNGDNSIDKKLK